MTRIPTTNVVLVRLAGLVATAIFYLGLAFLVMALVPLAVSLATDSASRLAVAVELTKTGFGLIGIALGEFALSAIIGFIQYARMK